MMLSNTVLVSAANSINKTVIETTMITSKIAPELQTVMDAAADNELIPVWIWLKSIDGAVIRQMMIDEHDMDPQVYKNEELFNKEVLPRIETAIVEKMGYEAAHTPVASVGVPTVSAKLSILNPEQIGTDYKSTPIDKAVSEEYDKYLANKRAITKREYGEYNAAFIDQYNIEEKIFFIAENQQPH